jgi:hypothetical protein
LGGDDIRAVVEGVEEKKCRVLRKVGEEMVAGRENYVRCDVMMNWRYLGVSCG